MRVLFIWWGRSGAMVPFTAMLAEAAAARADVTAAFSVSAESAVTPILERMGAEVVVVPTFERATGALRLDRLVSARARLAGQIARLQPDFAVVLMPHVWTPLTFDITRRARVPVGLIIHDATPHPGDPTAAVTSWINGAARAADRVLFLSDEVARSAERAGLTDPARTRVLFHPVTTHPVHLTASPSGALRVLFFGRLHSYRGLDVALEAVERLRAKGRAVELGVFGAGELGAVRRRLDAIGAEIVNRWIEEHEIAAILARHDVMALSHREASQSGAAALAIGAGMPVVATPVGALPAQVGEAGVVATAATGEAFAAALDQLACDPARLSALRVAAVRQAEAHAPARFLDALFAAMSEPAR